MHKDYYSKDGGFSKLETVLPDSYRLYGQRTYLFDGRFFKIAIAATDFISVFDYKQKYGVEEIRYFDQGHHVSNRPAHDDDGQTVADDILSSVGI